MGSLGILFDDWGVEAKEWTFGKILFCQGWFFAPFHGANDQRVFTAMDIMDTAEGIVRRAEQTENGFKDLQLAADEIVSSHTPDAAKGVALTLLRSKVHQARCVATFILGHLAASDPDALRILKTEVSKDDNWRVQEILAKAFDQFCLDTGYEAALAVIREWLSSASPNVRRAVTEGLRIWTSRPYFRDHPAIAIDLLASLRGDESEYVRKSVGNALRDISKKHPELVRQEVMGWDPTQRGTAQVHKLATRFISASVPANPASPKTDCG